MRTGVLCLLLVGVATACSVPADDRPRPYGAEESLLIESELDLPELADDPGDPGVTVDVWFVDGDRLVAVTRTVDDATPARLVEILVAGPRPAEESLGLRSAVAPTTAVHGVETIGSTARVDLSRDFALIGGEEELLAVGQVVATLVGLDGVDTVSFALDGEDIAVPDAEGVLRDRLEIGDVRPLVVQPAGP